VFNTSRTFPNDFMQAHVCALLEFYVFFWVPDSDKVFTDSVAMVSLKHDQPIFVCSAACAKRFEVMSDFLKVAVLVIDAVDDSCWSAEFSGFKPYTNPLLLFLYFSTNA
jgi:hypothetical protein